MGKIQTVTARMALGIGRPNELGEADFRNKLLGKNQHPTLVKSCPWELVAVNKYGLSILGKDVYASNTSVNIRMV